MNHITIDMPDPNSLPTKEWMMLCLPSRWDIIDLHQIAFTHRPSTNAEFFVRLKLEYDAKRYNLFPGWKFWSPRGRKITGIRFVKFRLAAIVTPRDVRVQDNPGLPGEGEEGWACKLRRDPSRAPLNANAML